MLKIRMQRIGRINQASFRIVVAEHARAAQAGRFVEKLGTYNPRTKEKTLNAERIKYWISVGAQPSGTMHNMLVSNGILSGKKVNVLPKKTLPQKEEAPVENPVAPTAEAPAEAAEAPAEETPAETPAESAPEEGDAPQA